MAKEIRFDAEARAALETGVNAVADAVRVTLGLKAVTLYCPVHTAHQPSPTMV